MTESHRPGQSRRPLVAALLTVALGLCAGEALAAGKEAPKKTVSEEVRRITAAESYIPVFGLSTAVTTESSFAGMIMVDAGLDVPDPKLRARVERMQPRVRDALRSALAEFALTRYRRGTAPDADAIKRLFQAAIDRTLGQTGATVVLANVLVQSR